MSECGARDPVTEPMPEIEVRRSARRRSTVSAYRDGGRVVVLVPARFTGAEEREWVLRMVERLDRRGRRRPRSDDQLRTRAAALTRRHLADCPAVATPASIRWVGNQRGRWGSCTPADRTIRLSTRLRGMPAWVVDYVLMHELCHLVEPGHTERFWALVSRYPRTERARGYLEGVAAAAGLPLSDEWDADDTPAGGGHPSGEGRPAGDGGANDAAFGDGGVSGDPAGDGHPGGGAAGAGRTHGQGGERESAR